MLKKIKNAFRLENLKNIASIMTGLALTVLAGVFLYMTIYETGNDIDVVGEAKIEVPKVEVFHIEAKYKNENGIKIIAEIKEKLKKEFKDVLINNEIQEKINQDLSKLFYKEKRSFEDNKFEFVVYFKNKNDIDLFKQFIEISFNNEIEIYSVFAKDKIFIDEQESILIENALKDAKNKAEAVAKGSNKKLGRIKRINVDRYSNSDDGDFIKKSVSVTYKLK